MGKECLLLLWQAYLLLSRAPRYAWRSEEGQAGLHQCFPYLHQVWSVF